MRSFLAIAVVMGLAGAAAAQDAMIPAAGQHEVLTVEGRGVQLYSCRAGQWVFVAPAARLFDKAGVEVGTHGDGPVWHLEDGSSVLGKVIEKAASPDAGAVPWLLVKAVATTGSGKLAGVEFIRRWETKGGVAPAAGCGDGELARVAYMTRYTFYSGR